MSFSSSSPHAGNVGATSLMDVGSGIEAQKLYHRFDGIPLRGLLEQASQLRDEGHGKLVTFSRKVFIPLTSHKPKPANFPLRFLIQTWAQRSSLPLLMFA